MKAARLNEQLFFMKIFKNQDNLGGKVLRLSYCKNYLSKGEQIKIQTVKISKIIC